MEALLGTSHHGGVERAPDFAPLEQETTHNSNNAHTMALSDLDKAMIYANINVSPDGIGKFISIAKGSSNSNAAYKQAIMQYLQNIKFDKADHESMLTVQFNFRVN